MKIFVLLARQRSGTGALGSFLDLHPDLMYIGEVFHPDNIDTDKYNYFNFINNLYSGNKDIDRICNPDKVFSQYLDYIIGCFPDKTIIIDAKYRSLHHLNGPWHGVLSAPGMLQFFMRNDIGILHLLRKNYLETFISGMLAEKYKQWHATEQNVITDQTTVLNIKKLSSYLVYTKSEVEQVQSWLSKYKRVTTLEYKDTFQDDGLVVPEIAKNLASFLNVADFANLKPVFVKQVRKEMTEVIENFDLVEYALRGTEFHWMCSSK